MFEEVYFIPGKENTAESTIYSRSGGVTLAIHVS